MKKSSAIIIIVVLIAVAAVAAFAAMGAGNKNNTQTQSTASTTPTENSTNKQSSNTATSTNAVEIKNFSFTPGTIKVKVGETVTWTNQDSAEHSVIADNESADAPRSELLAKGESYSFSFKKAGTYAYHCGAHPYMKATVTVE